MGCLQGRDGRPKLDQLTFVMIPGTLFSPFIHACISSHLCFCGFCGIVVPLGANVSCTSFLLGSAAGFL